jgi:hypothetical protein
VVVLVLALYGLIRLVPLPGLPCEWSPAEECPPGDEAIAFVPADTLAYAHLNLDRDSSQFESAEELAGRFPNFATIAQGSFRALGPGRRLDLAGDVFDWLGDEAAAAQLADRAGNPTPLLMLAVADEAGARGFLSEVGGDASGMTAHRGVDVTSYRDGLASAQSDGFLLLGSGAAVRAAIDAAGGEAESLLDDDEAERVRDSLPEDRLADAFVSRDGIEALLTGRGGVAGQLDTFTDFDASEGIAAALTAGEAGFEVELTSRLDPDAAEANPSFFSAFPPFEPSLASRFAPDTLALLGVGEPSQTAGALLDQAEAAFPGIADAVDRLDAELSAMGGAGIERDLLPLLKGEAAIGVAPARPVPYVSAVFDDVDEQRAREVVARLQAPLVAAFDPLATGQAPTFSRSEVDGVEIRSVRLSAGLQPSYAVFDDRLVVATAPAGVEEAIEVSGDLADSDVYQQTIDAVGGEVSALVFLDLAGLVRLAEPRGLAEIVSAFEEDLARLRALGLSVDSSENSLQTSIFLHIE